MREQCRPLKGTRVDLVVCSPDLRPGLVSAVAQDREEEAARLRRKERPAIKAGLVGLRIVAFAMKRFDARSSISGRNLCSEGICPRAASESALRRTLGWQ